MAVGTPSGKPVVGQKYTKTTDSSADWGSIANDTYFYDLTDEAVYYKDTNGVVQDKYKGSPSVQSVTSSATVTPTADDDEVIVTAQAEALTLANPTGSAKQGQALIIRLKDDGTARAITYGANYRAVGITLPTTTVLSKTTYIGMIYNSTDTKWDCISTVTEA
jgi:hypothetical protein